LEKRIRQNLKIALPTNAESDEGEASVIEVKLIWGPRPAISDPG
jgi:hypothetical protein